MYPETDVPPVRVDEARLARIRERLPEPPEVAIRRLARAYGIHEQQARQLFEDGTFGVFELIAREFGEARTAATTLTYTASEVRREGLDVDAILEDHWRELFSLLKAGRFAKEAIPGLVREMARRGVRASEAMTALGVAGMNPEDVERVVDDILDAAKDLLASKGEAAEKTLMGRAMERLRGHADGKLVSDVLRARLRERLASGKEKKQKN